LEIENEEYSLPKLDVEHFRSIQYLIGSSTEYDIDMLLLWVEKAANLLRLTMASDIGVYLSIQYIIKLHLFNSSNELFVDVLHYLENSLMYAE
jgi:hypothetical protein